MDTTVANTVLAQMGGMGRIKLFTGANSFIPHENGVSFYFPNRGGPNCVRIFLMPSDTYTVEFSKLSKGKQRVVTTHEDIYCDQLVELFERQTGLYLHL